MPPFEIIGKNTGDFSVSKMGERLGNEMDESFYRDGIMSSKGFGNAEAAARQQVAVEFLIGGKSEAHSALLLP